MEEKSGKSRKGFASMDPERQKEIASMGGRKAHQNGTAHQWTKDSAKEAGKKGGKAAALSRRKKAAQEEPR
jgi:general stress protein YciG